MSALAVDLERSVELRELGTLTAIARSGGQGRVYVAQRTPESLPPATVVKLYRSAPRRSAASTLAEMVRWDRWLVPEQRELLHHLAAWPLATVTSDGAFTGIVMRDVRDRFELPFLMPSGRTANVLLRLEHLLGADDYLLQRGLSAALDTPTRARVAERISVALAFLHRHAIVVSDVSPNNLLISLSGAAPEVCFIDCDSMVFHGRQALASVETADWQIPPEFEEPPLSRAADAYKLGLIVLRLFARSHDARTLEPHVRHVPAELVGLLARALSPDAPNRPPAGEWQLALRRALASSELQRSHPGPRPRPRPSALAQQDGVQDRVRRAASGAMPASAQAPARHRQGPASPRLTRPRSGPFNGLTVAWLVAGVLLVLVFVRLLQDASVSSSAGPLAGERAAVLPAGAGYLERGSPAYASPGGASVPQGEEGALEPGAPSR